MGIYNCADADALAIPACVPLYTPKTRGHFFFVFSLLLFVLLLSFIHSCGPSYPAQRLNGPPRISPAGDRKRIFGQRREENKKKSSPPRYLRKTSPAALLYTHTVTFGESSRVHTHTHALCAGSTRPNELARSLARSTTQRPQRLLGPGEPGVSRFYIAPAERKSRFVGLRTRTTPHYLPRV